MWFTVGCSKDFADPIYDIEADSRGQAHAVAHKLRIDEPWTVEPVDEPHAYALSLEYDTFVVHKMADGVLIPMQVPYRSPKDR